jgi:hypothetical protein
MRTPDNNGFVIPFLGSELSENRLPRGGYNPTGSLNAPKTSLSTWVISPSVA